VDVAESRAEFEDAVISAINANRQSASKWNPLYDWYFEEFGVEVGEVAGKLLTENKQLSNRIKKELVQKAPRYVVLCALPSDFDLDDVMRHLSEAELPLARSVVIMEEAQPKRLIVFEADGVSKRFTELFPEVPVEERARPGSGVSAAGAAAAVAAVPPSVAVIQPEIEVDDRVRRMLAVSISTATGVMVVGPPGTGKTSLLREVVKDILADPEKFGFSPGLVEPIWATPEEGWSSVDLLGGETLRGGEIVFSAGHVLNAIKENRWLILDEANRADMDKIFGGLLTWLEGQPVRLGLASKKANAPAVLLEWGEEAECSYSNLEALADGGTDEPVRFAAGLDWRILGTYNAVDAQRVFRFGQALGRRFMRVPVPPITVEQFDSALKPHTETLQAVVHEAIVKLYRAHYVGEDTQLGPALFLRMPRYVLSALKPDVEFREVLAEAYLVNVGASLSRFDPVVVDELSQRIVMQEGVFAEGEWQWIRSLSGALG
jgi:MoxR-like ATPase